MAGTRGATAPGTPRSTDVTALLVSYSGHFGGGERLLVDYAGALQGERVLACPEGALAERARAAGLRVIPLPRRPLELRGPVRQRVAAAMALAAHGAEVRRLIRDLRPRLVLSSGMRSALALGALPLPSADRPWMVFLHNDLLPSPLVGGLVRAASRRFDRVVALSGAVARDLDPQEALGERLRVCHPGVDLERFPALPAPATPGGALLLGAIADWKRPGLALEALALASGRLPQARLVVAGAPLDEGGEELLAQLGTRIAQPDLQGRVLLAGRVDSASALGDSSCLLHCADQEPFGLVVLEALACGRPVVAPAGGGPAELLDDSVGRLYEPGNAAAAADALVEVLSDPQATLRMGAAARRRAEERHDVASARRRWLEAIGGPEPEDTAPGAGEGLALVTVIHDSEAELGAFLSSVRRHLPAAHVVVVDSGSSDSGAELARTSGGRVTVVELGENVGFGTATNRGLAATSEAVVAVVNPDVELVDDSLAALAAEVARPDRPERLLAPLVLLPGGKRQDSVHPPPGSGADLARSLVPPGALPPALALPLAPWRSGRPRRVGWAVACCVVAQASTLRRLGPFDERIFLYAEDMDLGLRAQRAGVETWFWPGARVLHKRAHSSERSFGGEPFDLLAVRRREVVARNRGARAARVDDAAQAVTFASRIALKRILRRPAAREARQLAALRRALRHRVPGRDRSS